MLANDRFGRRYSGHATTFEAAVHGFGSAHELKKLRKEVNEKFPPAKVSTAPMFRVSRCWYSRASINHSLKSRLAGGRGEADRHMYNLRTFGATSCVLFLRISNYFLFSVLSRDLVGMPWLKPVCGCDGYGSALSRAMIYI